MRKTPHNDRRSCERPIAPLVWPHYRALAEFLRGQPTFQVLLRCNVDAAACEGLRFKACDPAKAARYAEAMKRGEFGLAPDPIYIDNGRAGGGNHRLTAIVLHGTTLPLGTFVFESQAPLGVFSRSVGQCATSLLWRAAGALGVEVGQTCGPLTQDLDMTSQLITRLRKLGAGTR
jgi:hypothetical protein